MGERGGAASGVEKAAATASGIVGANRGVLLRASDDLQRNSTTLSYSASLCHTVKGQRHHSSSFRPRSSYSTVLHSGVINKTKLRQSVVKLEVEVDAEGCPSFHHHPALRRNSRHTDMQCIRHPPHCRTSANGTRLYSFIKRRCWQDEISKLFMIHCSVPQLPLRRQLLSSSNSAARSDIGSSSDGSSVHS